MDVFNSNRRLEEVVMYGLDWGMFLRHNIEGGIAPFMYLQNGKELKVRMFITDGNPVEFAKSILKQEEEPFEQFVIGFEGYLRDDKNNKADAIIVQAFDVTQPKGVSLGQIFNPMEKGGFRKIDKPVFIDRPDLIIDQKTNPDADYSVEEIGFNAMAFLDDKQLTAYVVILVSSNPTVIANTIKRFLRSKFGGAKNQELSGQIVINISKAEVKNEDFLVFLVANSINEELESESVKSWQNQTKRTIDISCKLGEKTIYENKLLNLAAIPTSNENVETNSNPSLVNTSKEAISTSNENAENSAFDNRPKKEITKKWWEFWK